MRGPWDILAVVVEDGEDGSMPVSYLIGPILVGVLLNCFVYGVVFLHWIQYSLGRNVDQNYLKGLVHWCFLVDTVHSAAALWLLWFFSVQHFNDTGSLITAKWPVVISPLFVSLVAVPIQHLFAWRIKQFTHSMPLFVVLSFLSIASGVLGIVTTARGLIRQDISASHVLIPLVDSWLALGMACDVFLAILLYMHLLKSKTGFRNTDTVIGRLMRSSVETTALSALFCTLYLLNFTIVPKTNFHIIWSLPLGRIYTGTLLSTLNSRTTLREELFGGPSVNGDRLGEAFQISERMRRMPTEVAINVQQEVQSEQLEEVDFKRLRKGVRKTSGADGKDDIKLSVGGLEFEAV